MNGDRPLRVGDTVRPVHPQYGPQEPGVVIGFRHDRCMAADAREVQIRRSDGTAATYMVHETWRMEPVAASAKVVISREDCGTVTTIWPDPSPIDEPSTEA